MIRALGLVMLGCAAVAPQWVVPAYLEPLPERHVELCVPEELAPAFNDAVAAWQRAGSPVEVWVTERECGPLDYSVTVEEYPFRCGPVVEANGCTTIGPGQRSIRMLADSWRFIVARHELGHFLGLPHSLDVNSVMYDRAQSYAITDADVAGLRSLYP